MQYLDCIFRQFQFGLLEYGLRKDQKTTEGTTAGVFGARTKYYKPTGKLPNIFQAEIHTIEWCVQINSDKGQNEKDKKSLFRLIASIKLLHHYI